MKKLMGIIICGGLLYGHHAMEYIEMESYSTALKGEKVFHLHYDYFVEEKNNPDFDHWEFTPGISYGIIDYIMFDAHTHFSKFNKGFTKNNEEISPFIEALATSIQFRIPKFTFLDFGFVLSYEIPFKRAREYIDGKEVFEGKIIVSKDFGEHSNLCFNFNFVKDGDEFLKEWAFGIKNPLSSDPHGIAGGIEILGDYEGSLFFLPGIYFPIENSILKTGIGFGNNKSTNLRANLTLMYRF
jgi:hypothetical protein